MLSLLADQIGCRTDDFADYSARATTLREHRAEIEAQLGLRAFDRIDVRSMLALGSEIATSTDRGEAIVAGMVDRLRLDRIVLPAASTLERLALIVRAQARKAAHAGLIRDCSTEQIAALERLIVSDDNGRTRLGWIREWPEAPSASNLKGIVERLDAVRGIGIAADRARRIHAARYAVIARTAIRRRRGTEGPALRNAAACADHRLAGGSRRMVGFRGSFRPCPQRREGLRSIRVNGRDPRRCNQPRAGPDGGEFARADAAPPALDGRMAPVPAMGLMAGYGVQLWPILQDVHQLRALYGQRAGTFLSNAGVLQVFGVNNQDSAKLVSDLAGQETVVFETMSRAIDAEEKAASPMGNSTSAAPCSPPMKSAHSAPIASSCSSPDNGRSSPPSYATMPIASSPGGSIPRD